VAAGVYVTVHQAQSTVPDNGAWPQSFGEASKWAWAAVAFLGAEGAVDVVLRARRRRALSPAGRGPLHRAQRGHRWRSRPK